MREQQGNVWDILRPGEALAITTNGFVTKSGNAVMGRGIALEAKQRMSWLPRLLGKRISEGGNHVFVLSQQGVTFLSFPVKPVTGPTGEPGWMSQAELPLIEQSARELVVVARALSLDVVYLPRPGCGNGHLSWADVRPVIEPLLDDRFVIVSLVSDI